MIFNKNNEICISIIFIIAGLGISFAQTTKEPTFEKGKLLMLEGKYSQSSEVFEDLIKKDSSNSDALYYLGINYQAISNFPKAVSAFQKALSYKPGDIKLMSLLGNNYYAAGRVSDADSILTKAFSQDSSDVQILTSLGKVYLHEHLWEKADNIYSILTELDSSNSFYYGQKAVCEIQMKDFEDAIINYQIAHHFKSA